MSERKYNPLVELTVVRTREFLRETEAVFWVFGFPILLAVALGFAFRSQEPGRVAVGVVRGPFAAAQAAALAKSPALRPRIVAGSEGAALLRAGKVALLVSGGPVPVYRFEPNRPESRLARLEADDALQRAAGRRDLFEAREIRVEEQGSRYIDFLMPGLLGMNLMSTGMWGMGFAIVNARMKKLLKRLVATPMRKTHYVASQFLSRLIFLVAEVTILVAFGWIVFGVRVHGSLVTLTVLCLAGGFAFAGLGLLTASRARTIEGVSGLLNVVMMPMWLCSGVFFSYERFPEAVQPLIRALPLTALNDALRGVMNEAMTLTQVLPAVAMLIAWGMVTFLVGLRIFRWQ